MIRPQHVIALALALVVGFAPSWAEEKTKTFEQTAASAQSDLEKALQELAAMRKQIAAEKLPLNRKMTALESEIVTIRGRFQDTSRTLDNENLSLANSESDLKSRKDEKAYLENLLSEYLRNFETRIHISERQRYDEALRLAHEAPTNGNLTPSEVFERQAAMVEISLDRLLESIGGETFEGKAVDPDDSLVKDATFAVIGPVAIYRATDGSSAGVVQEVLNSLEPNMIRLDDPERSDQIAALVASGTGRLPLDPTLGNAQKVENTNETLTEHLANAVGWPPGTGKGGPVMLPIVLMAAASMLVALFKMIQLARVPQPSRKRIDKLLDAIKNRDFDAARAQAPKLAGPTGEMLQAGVENIDEPKALIEEVMFEKTLETRLKLQSFLPFIQVSAAAAPLLGLLGTVTGIINTFKLITVFGTGDAKTLSGGISEALITTEFGLVIAIPSLLMHAYLSRKARRLLDGMEKSGVGLLNRVRPEQTPPDAVVVEEPPARETVIATAQEALRGLPISATAAPATQATDH